MKRVTGLLALIVLGVSIYAWFSLRSIASEFRVALSDVPEFHQTEAPWPTLRPGPIFVVYAHPDDELLASRLLAEWTVTRPQNPIHWILITPGDAGKCLHLACLFSSLGEVRTRESNQSAACLGIPEPTLLGLRDGTLKKDSNLKATILKEISRLAAGQPVAAIVSSDNRGLYGHSDHLRAHDVSLEIAQDLGAVFVAPVPPEKIWNLLPHWPGSEQRKADIATHVFDPAKSSVKDLTLRAECAFGAHKTQWLVLKGLMHGVPTHEFLNQLLKKDLFHVEDFSTSHRL